MTVHASDSTPQQDAEPLFRDALEELTGLTYSPEDVHCGDFYVKCDAVGRNENNDVIELAEIYARQDPLHGAQPKKLNDDAARLMIAQRHCYPDAILRLVSSPIVVDQIQRSWRHLALVEMGVELTPVQLDEETIASIRKAQHDQKR